MAKFEDGIIFTNSEKAEIDLETKLHSIEQSIGSIEQTVEGVQDGTIAATNAKNVSSTIAGKAITDIFENNGTTVKNATNANHATSADSATKATQDGNGQNIVSTYATQSALTSGLNGKADKNGSYASMSVGNYTSSGTIKSKFDDIESRLNNLGFKSGTISLQSGYSASVNWVKKTGKYVIGQLVLSTAIQDRMLAGTTTFSKTVNIGTLPNDFRPAQQQNITLCNVEQSGAIALTNPTTFVCSASITTGGEIRLSISGRRPGNTAGSILATSFSNLGMVLGFETP